MGAVNINVIKLHHGVLHDGRPQGGTGKSRSPPPPPPAMLRAFLLCVSPHIWKTFFTMRGLLFPYVGSLVCPFLSLPPLPPLRKFPRAPMEYSLPSSNYNNYGSVM